MQNQSAMMPECKPVLERRVVVESDVKDLAHGFYRLPGAKRDLVFVATENEFWLSDQLLTLTIFPAEYDVHGLEVETRTSDGAKILRFWSPEKLLAKCVAPEKYTMESIREDLERMAIAEGTI